mgnify:CR=1 FL=1
MQRHARPPPAAGLDAMNQLTRFPSSTLGLTSVFALTRLAMVLFLLGHLLGNLQVFLPKEKINAYAHFLHANAALLWGARLGLLATVGLHVWAAVTLTRRNRAARPAGYAGDPAPAAASYASRTMFMSGLIIAAFVLYHLAHYTWQVPAVNFLADGPAKDFGALRVAAGPQQGYHDVHAMLVHGFSHPVPVLFYFAGLALLCLHLSHGLSAMFQTLGVRSGVWRSRLDLGAKVMAAGLFLAYASIPAAAYLRLIPN